MLRVSPRESIYPSARDTAQPLPVSHEPTQEITLGGGAGDPVGAAGAFVARYRFVPRGDANGDGCVDNTDLLAMLYAFGSEGSSLSADLDGNGRVDDADWLVMLFGWGEGCT